MAIRCTTQRYQKARKFKFVGKSLGNLLFEHLAKKVWLINRSAKRLLIVNTIIWMVLLWQIIDDSQNSTDSRNSAHSYYLMIYN